MPRFTPRQSDVDRFKHLYLRTKTLLEDAAESMESSGYGDFINKVLPILVPMDSFTTGELKSQFITRKDFNAQIRYMESIQKAAREEPYKGTAELGYYGNLTAVRYDKDGTNIEGAFLSHARKVQVANERRATLKRIKEAGVEVEKVHVSIVDEDTGEIRPMYDEHRHKVYTYVPKTPENARKLDELTFRSPDYDIPQPDIPEEGVIFHLGDFVPVRKRRASKSTPEQVLRGTRRDTMDDYRLMNYFNNYESIVSVTMPDSVKREIGCYINAIMDASPAKRNEIYRFIADNGDDAATLEYLYVDMASPLPQKVQRIMDFWRNEVVPKIGDRELERYARDKKKVSLDTYVGELEEMGYKPGMSVLDEYRRRKEEGQTISVDFDTIRRALVARTKNK